MKNFDIPAPTPPPPLPSAEDGHEALVRIEPELCSIPEKELAHINIDIPRACALALGALPAIRSLRASVVEHLPTFPIESLDKLEDYTYALYYAQLMCAPKRRRGEGVQALFAEVTELRTLLLAQAKLLAMKGMFDRAKVEEISSGSGYVDAANDIIALSLLYRQNWSLVKDKTVVEEADGRRADVLGRELLAAMGARMQASDRLTNAQTVDRRNRCYTLFIRAYDRCRQVASHLRWDQGDADVLVPPLVRRSKRKGRRPEATATASDDAVSEPKRVA